MSKRTKRLGMPQWLMVGGAVLVTVLLVLAPRAPKGGAQSNASAAEGRVSEDPESGSTPRAEGPLAKDPRVAAILEELNAGGPPMQTILKLRDLAEQEPDNVEAQFVLGTLSWQTGQYEKAMERFRKVIALDPKGYPDAYAFLGRAYASLDSTPQAIGALETYKTLVTDTALTNGAQRLIDELKTKGT
jgi:tetratricopeptide (TPR) repeat protein